MRLVTINNLLKSVAIPLLKFLKRLKAEKLIMVFSKGSTP